MGESLDSKLASLVSMLYYLGKQEEADAICALQKLMKLEKIRFVSELEGYVDGLSVKV